MTQAVNLFPGELGSINNVSKKIVAAGALTADVDSGPFNINQFSNVAVQIIAGAGATGEFFIQGSNVLDPTASDWVTIPFVDSTGAAQTFALSGSALTFLANAQGLGFSYLRVIYDFTSGTGTADVWLTLKGV
jgi:hypothetical protein